MLIIPAILEKKSEAAFEQLDIIRSVVPWVQIDFLDGSMTTNKSVDLGDLEGSLNELEVEVHLMTTNPEMYFDVCEQIGAKRVYFHLDEVESPGAVLAAMDTYGFTKGIALSPQTPVHDVFTYIDEIDAVQVMTVVPGAQGSPFLENMLDKIPFLRERRTEIWISVDGGVNEKTINLVAAKQIDAAGVGSAISQSADPVEAIRDLAIAAETAETI